MHSSRLCSTLLRLNFSIHNKKGKVLPYLLPSVGSRADPGVQAVIPGGRLPLLYAEPASLPHKRSPDGATTD